MRTRQPIDLDALQLVSTRPGFPQVYQPCMAGVKLREWAAAHQAELELALEQCGALLFRGFGIGTADTLEPLVQIFSRDFYADYAELPRSPESAGSYHSTPYPEEHYILFHNEGAHRAEVPRLQWFCCAQPASHGGATLIADGVAVAARLGPVWLEKLQRLGLIYTRYISPHMDGGLRGYFGSEDRAQVENLCREWNLRWEWEGDRLIVRHRAPAILSGTVFFSQILLHHSYFLPPSVRQLLGDRPPRQVCYGDESELEVELLEAIRVAYEQLQVAVEWQQGDLLLVNNLRVAHARAPFRGPRRLLVALGDRVRP